MTSSTSSPLGTFLTNPLGFFSDVIGSASALAAAWWVVALPASVAACCVGVGCRLTLDVRRRRHATGHGRLISIHVPSQVEQGSAEAFWAHVHALLRPTWRRVLDGRPQLAFELVWHGDALNVQIWVPSTVAPGVIEAAIEAAWPGAQTSVLSPAPSPLPATTASATGGRLCLANPAYLPLKVKHEADPLRPLLRAASGMDSDDTACVQLLARPASRRHARRFRHDLDRFRVRTLSGAFPSSPHAALLDELSPTSHTRAFQRTDPVQASALRAAVSKTSSPLWLAELRYAVGTESTACEDARRIRGTAHSLASAFGIFAERNWWRRRRLAAPAAAFAARRMRHGDPLSVAELAAIAHLPLDPTALGLSRAGARSVTPPPSIPARADSHRIKILGDADAGPSRPIGIAVEDARQHFHIMGATNSGKSTLMARMILDDIEAGRGVVLLDPKGDLVGDLLDRLPESAADRLVLIDPTNDGPRPCLNILALGEPELMVDNVVGIFRRLFASSWGPRTDDVLRAACLTLLATARDQPPTLADVAHLLTDKTFRDTRSAGLSDQHHKILKSFWRWFGDLSDQSQAAVTAPLQNKLRAFLLREFVTDVIARPESTLDLGAVLDGGICLVRLPKGVLGDETMRLLGSFIVAAAWQATTARAGRPEHERREAAIYIDEAHNFLNLPYSLEDMLAEARAYRVSFNLAHQNLAQMPTELAEGISANARNKVFFTCSPEDARTLAAHTAPTLAEHDLSHLGRYQAAVRLTTNQAQVQAFTMQTRPAPAPILGRADAIRAALRAAATSR